MFSQELGKVSDELIAPFVDECEEKVAEMIINMVIENEKLPTLSECFEDIEFHNTRVLDEMVELYMSRGEGYVICGKPSNPWDECGRCEDYSACYSSIIESNIAPFHREVFDDGPIASLIFSALRLTRVSISIGSSSHRLYGEFMDCYDSDNQAILDNMYYTNPDQVVYANHAQMTMFDSMFMDTPGSVFRFGTNAAIVYDSFNYRYNSFYLEQEDEHALIDNRG